jgi:hypothetical protein
MAKKCRGGVCGLNKVPRSNPTPQAVYPSATQPMSQLGQGVPQQYNPLAGLQQNISQMPQASQAAASPIAQQLQGLPQQSTIFPQQGSLSGGVFYNPYNQQQQFVPQQGNSAGLPSPTAQNTALPQGQVIHPTGKQRGSAGRAIMGTRPQIYNNPLYTDYQNSVLNYITQLGLGGIQNLNQDQFDFAPIGNQELERFYTQTIPSIAERFTAMGDGQRSSAFQGALGNAGRFLSNDLASQQQQYNLQQQGMNQNLYTNLLSLGLRPQFESNLQPGKNGILPGIVNAGTKLIGTAITGGF